MGRLRAEGGPVICQKFSMGNHASQRDQKEEGLYFQNPGAWRVLWFVLSPVRQWNLALAWTCRKATAPVGGSPGELALSSSARQALCSWECWKREPSGAPLLLLTLRKRKSLLPASPSICHLPVVELSRRPAG